MRSSPPKRAEAPRPWQAAQLGEAQWCRLRASSKVAAAHRAPRLEWQLAALRTLCIVALPMDALPAALRAARSAPAMLYVRGNPDLLWRPGVAIVGSRRAVPSTCRWAGQVAQQAAMAKYVVVSGGALGVDAAAHRAALRAGRPTAVYLGTAIDCIYPAAHRALFAQIVAQGGALVSEHPPGAATQAYHHAQRNRLIAAHGEQLYVAEAAARSGTLSTATAARTLGRPIFVPPAQVGGERAGIDGLCVAGRAQVAEGFVVPPCHVGDG